MKKKQIENMTIPEYYSYVKELQKELAELKKSIKKEPEFEVGKWYKHNEKESLFCVTKLKNGDLHAYGFDYRGRWSDDDFFGYSADVKEMTPATNKEVEEALIKEAKRRGFKEGNHRCLNSAVTAHKTKEEYFLENGILWRGTQSNANCIFKDGIWAEIIEEPKVVINNEAMKQEKHIISFGCAKFSKTQLFEWLSSSTGWSGSNRTVQSITLDSGVELSIEDLKKIVDNIK